MTDRTVNLDIVGIAAQKATDLRRALAEVEAQSGNCASGRPSSSTV